MRTSVLAATLTSVLGVTAFEKALEDALAYLQRSGCGELDGCGKVPKGSYLPDAKTFVFPDKGYEHGNRWELINKHPHHGHHHDLHSYVNFDFREESLIFDFEKVEEDGHVTTKEKLRYEQIQIQVAVEDPQFDKAHRYSLKDGHCHDHHGHYRCQLPYRDLVHGGYHEMCPSKEKGGKNLFVKIETVVVAGEERIELCNRGTKEKEYFRLSYACTECKYEQYEKDCPHKPHHEHHHDHKHHHHGEHHGQHHHDPKPCGCAAKKHHHPHGRRDIDYECTGTFLEAYGTGKHSHPLKEIGCHHDHGYFHRYPKKELEVSVDGPIELNGHSFGHFTVKLDKKREDVTLLIDVKVDDPQYFVTEIAAIIVCEDGLQEKKDKDICKPSSYPHRHHDNHGLDHYHFDIADEFKCKGDYFIAVYVLVCVAEDKCEYKKVGSGY